jgi:histidinol-phosphate aminotransferase
MTTPFEVPLRSEISRIVSYIPGTQIKDLKEKFNFEHVIKLASNENPLGSSPNVKKILNKSFSDIRLYPDGEAKALRTSLSDQLKVNVNNIIVGNGSNELIVLLALMILKPGDQVVFGSPSFPVYSIVSSMFGSIAKPVALTNYTFDLEKLLDNITSKTKIVFICNPNNPTGTIVSAIKIEEFLKKISSKILVVLDEAYVEYVQDQACKDTIQLLHRYSNLVILRTFSKAYGLAGLRVGYGIAHVDLISNLQKVRQPFNVNFLALKTAEVALNDQKFLKQVIHLNTRMRTLLTSQLYNMGLSVPKSESNFVYIEIKDAYKIYEKLLKKGIIIRPIQKNSIRVTTGTETQTMSFLNQFKKII